MAANNTKFSSVLRAWADCNRIGGHTRTIRSVASESAVRRSSVCPKIGCGSQSETISPCGSCFSFSPCWHSSAPPCGRPTASLCKANARSSRSNARMGHGKACTAAADSLRQTDSGSVRSDPTERSCFGRLGLRHLLASSRTATSQTAGTGPVGPALTQCERSRCRCLEECRFQIRSDGSGPFMRLPSGDGLFSDWVYPSAAMPTSDIGVAIE